MTAHEALRSVGELVDSWCAQRKLKPLGFVLQAYPMANQLTDGWGDLLNSLERVRAFCHDELSETEADALHACIVAIQGVVFR